LELPKDEEELDNELPPLGLLKLLRLEPELDWLLEKSDGPMEL
jgi:hypothetical protein